MSSENTETIELLGKELKCQICSHNKFWKREAQLNTAAATFFGFDWANASAICVMCGNCGYIHWFFPMNK